MLALHTPDAASSQYDVSHGPLCMPVTLRKKRIFNVMPCLVLHNLIESISLLSLRSVMRKIAVRLECACVTAAVWSSGVMLYVMLCCQYPVRSCLIVRLVMCLLMGSACPRQLHPDASRSPCSEAVCAIIQCNERDDVCATGSCSLMMRGMRCWARRRCRCGRANAPRRVRAASSPLHSCQKP